MEGADDAIVSKPPLEATLALRGVAILDLLSALLGVSAPMIPPLRKVLCQGYQTEKLRTKASDQCIKSFNQRSDTATISYADLY
jgi:hypothetical protein